jgi:hypothetical protein
VRTLQLLTLIAVAIAAASCANVDSSGTGGTGGTGGAAATGGMGGAEGTRLLPQPVLTSEPESFAAEPPGDSVDAGLGVATGQVSGACSSGSCIGSDPADQWSILPSVTGEHRIQLTWSSVSSDLDLFLTDASGAKLGESINQGTAPETIVATLTAGRVYIIQVQTWDTGGNTQPYTLQITYGE